MVTIIITLFSIILIGGFIFQKIQKKNSIKDGISDFMAWFFYELGWRPAMDHTLILTFEEAELWLKKLESIIHEPDLQGCLTNDFNGLLVINIDFLSFTPILTEKSKLEKQCAIARSLSSFYRIYRRVRVNWRTFYFQAFAENYFEIWIPLNEKGSSMIQGLKSKKIKK
ncbi:MAG: hypothetical protein KH368_07780 [Limosilactobacillus reuteri]|nr:hypothetical protein [Limosilactobacillus reuteri]